MPDDATANSNTSSNAIPLLTTELPNETQPNTNEFSDFVPPAQAAEIPMADAAGELWQELRHRSPPEKNKRGLWIMRRGRPLCEPKYVTQVADSDAQNVSGMSDAELDATAQVYSDAWGQLHTIPFGEAGFDAKLLIPLKTGIKNYLKVKPLPPMPPEVPIIMGALGYTNTIARKPQNIEKTRRVINKILTPVKSWIFKNKVKDVSPT